MIEYIVTFWSHKDKINLIKAVRCFGPFGLGQAKAIVEQSFRSFSDNYGVVDFCVTQEMLGYYYAMTFSDQPPCIDIKKIERVGGRIVNLAEHTPQ
jgi:hypothetical protein